MKPTQIVKDLTEAVRQLGLEVRTDRGSFRGGLCKIDGQDIIMLNKRHPPEMHLAVLAESLHGQPVDTIFLRPAVRAALEEVWARRTPTALAVEPDDA